MKELTPQDYINYYVITEVLKDNEDLSLVEGTIVTLENATKITEDPLEYIKGCDYVDEYIYEELNYTFRESGEECNLYSSQSSRHYECDFKVRQIEDKWIGWTYWYGGGKHGEPEAIDWVSDAEFVEVESEEEVTVMQRVFKRK